MGSEPAPEVIAIIPVRGRDAETDGAPIMIGDTPLISHTIEAALRCPVVRRTVVTTDSPTVRDLAIGLGAESPFLRPADLAGSGVSLDRVLQHCLQWLEENEGYHADIVLSMETSHPIRPPDLLEQVVDVLVDQKLDTVVTVYEERHPFWRVNEYGELNAIGDEEAVPRPQRRPLYRQLAGVGLACKGDLLLREGRRFGDRVGIIPLRESSALIDTQDPLGLVLAKHVLGQGPREAII